jgi:hypothetical protein
MTGQSGQHGSMWRPSSFRGIGSGPRSEATRRRWRRWRDALASIRTGDRGIEARARLRIRNAGLPEEGITIEAWKGDVTLRGEASTEMGRRYGDEVRQVRGVKDVMNFIHPAQPPAS